MKKLIIVAMLLAFADVSFGAGFGIYEASARGLAMGDSVVGDVHDATANYHNPANIANATNVQVALGATFINPFYDVNVDHVSQSRMNGGWFTVPHIYLTIPLPADFAFGWGNYTEYGAGTEYNSSWDGANDSISTTLEQFTLNPNLAYKVNDWWNVSVGARLSNLRFVSHKHITNYDAGGMLGLPVSYYIPSDMHTKIKGDDWSLGYNAAMSFKVHEDVSIGLIYRSRIRHKLGAKSVLSGAAYPPGVGTVPVAGWSGDASGKVRLPDSLVLGVNWNATERYRVGSAITYTRWSSVDRIEFKLPNNRTEILNLNWKDTVRIGFGMEYDFTDWLCGRLGYMYDRDPSSPRYINTMIPPGDRHIICLGSGIKLMENLYFDLAYSFIRMNNEHGYLSTPGKTALGTDAKNPYVSFRNGGSHLVSATLRYEF